MPLRWGVGVGNRLTLESPTGTLERPILGFLDDYRSEKGTIFMDRALYKKYWGDDAVDFIDVDLNPGVDQLAMKQEIERLTAGSFHAFVYTNAEFKRWISSLVDQFFTLNYMQLVVAVLIAILGIVNTLLISVSERRREIGIVRAIGGLRDANPETRVAGGGGGGHRRCDRRLGGRSSKHRVHVAHRVPGAGRLFGAVLFSVGICSALRARRDGGVARGRLVAGAERGAHAGDRGDRL